jgi:3-deoxy-D-manno-octulosonate 8-phosphate phosphatase (KDO 8-P phosphatase)
MIMEITKVKMMGYFKEDICMVKAFVFDVDGVFSDGILVLNPDGELTRSMNIKDGFAVQLAVRKGFPVGIITGSNSESIRKRFSTLGVESVYLKSSRKLDDFTDFCKKYDLAPENVMYMGDDLPDYPVMEKAGFPVCPKDAVSEIKQIARYISDRNGGKGCVRDVIEQVLRTQDKWMDADTFII